MKTRVKARKRERESMKDHGQVESMKDHGQVESMDEHLAMKLPFDEGLSTRAANDSVTVLSNFVPDFVPTVASLDPDRSPDIYFNHDMDEDYELAWKTQVQENQRTTQRHVVAETDQFTSENEKTIPLKLRMGAAPYETTGPGRLRNLIGSRFHSDARQNAILLDLPPGLLQQQRPHIHSASANNALSGSVPQNSNFPQPTTAISTTNELLGEQQPTRHVIASRVWYDVCRPGDGDPVCLCLLGYYPGDPAASKYDARLCLKNISSDRIPSLSSDPTKLAETVSAATLTNFNDDNNDHNCTQTSSNMMDMEGIIRQCHYLQISLRQAAIHLPFSLRFQLERCMFMDPATNNDSHIYTRQKHAPKNPAYGATKKEALSYQSRKMLVVFLQMVLPPLLRSTERLQHSLTLQELFAEAIWESLLDVKKEIKLGKAVSPIFAQVEEAMNRALTILQGAEKLVGCTEAELQSWNKGQENNNSNDNDSESYTHFIRKRSLWPMAEYRVQFTQDGRLLPKGYEVVNKLNAEKGLEKGWTMRKALKYTKAETRRALRETGWSVRDRFVAFSDVPYNNFIRDNLKSWCRGRPMVCGRRYEFLFDKGA
jgi:hypothetical protein